MISLKQYDRSGVEGFRIWFHANFTFLIRLYLNFLWKPKNEIERILNEFSRKTTDFTFVQIGANDGLTNDPIIKFIIRDEWTGLRVEPLRVPFEKLKSLHSNSKKVTLMNCLVGDENRTRTLYQISFSSSRWATGIASLRRDTLQKLIDNGYVESRAKKNNEAMPADVDDWITSSDLAMIELNELLEKNTKGKLDLLQIDTEGYDVTLLNTLDLNKYLPKMICFEKAQVSENELNDCLARLADHGYRSVSTKMDVLAFQEGCL